MVFSAQTLSSHCGVVDVQCMHAVHFDECMVRCDVGRPRVRGAGALGRGPFIINEPAGVCDEEEATPVVSVQFGEEGPGSY